VASRRHARRRVGIAEGRRGRFSYRTFEQLYDDACLASAKLHALGIRAEDPVLVALPTSWDWIEAWFGALLLGARPLSVAPARLLGAAESHLEKLDALVEALQIRHVICRDSLGTTAARAGFESLAARALGTSTLAATRPSPTWGPHRAEPDSIAHLQMTSGSTGRPRAVMLSHRNVLHNVAAIDEIIGRPGGGPAHEWADAYGSWLPLHHDMGLVGCLLNPLLCGLDTHLIETTAFLTRPALWLETLARNGITLTTAPNQGYQHVVDRLAGQAPQIPLGGWRAALIGAEPVRSETTSAFAEALEPAGFAPTAFRPCYGLAEATLAVTMDAKGLGVRTEADPSLPGSSKSKGSVVCTGEPLRDTRVRIVALDGRPRPDHSIGEIQVRGPGVFQGYLGDAAAARDMMDGAWLRTGDLGFVVGGELFVTGRIKELIIIGGENVMPEEIERPVDAALRDIGSGGRSAAFAVDDARFGELPVVVVETTPQRTGDVGELERELREAVGRSLAIQLADVVFVSRGGIPRTSSGKPQRIELRQRYLSGRLPRVAGS